MFVGCPCHLVHNTASKAAEVFEDVPGLDFLIDLYYWFEESTYTKK